MTEIGKRNEITDLSLNFQGYIPGRNREEGPGGGTESLDPVLQGDEGLNVNSEGWQGLWQRREHAQPLAIKFYENKRQKAKSNLKTLSWPNKTQP